MMPSRRGGDGFSSFRDVLCRGLDRYQSNVGFGADQQCALGEFEDAMAEAARSLSKATSQISLKERAKGSVLPATWPGSHKYDRGPRTHWSGGRSGHNGV